ncbi:anthranilate synthase component I [Oceanimonas sp. GK1]|uniref:anthranilate synthase component 1 n=1 Tax=Oceanimonas sp. (strain GK1 / IBRC-M 10197) TaxID=511062 RepID=UPI0002495115|nr:anthranilate synthase component 1 [Oceanimonas sp. GK1]AEY02269.1 anthranilate synthase component I [Oceanimonas sp. GK1]
MAQGQLHVLLQNAPYTDDPLALYAALSQPGDNSLLLESAEIDTKAGTQSLLMLDACVRLVCHGRTVTLSALNANGLPALELIHHELGGERTERELTVTLAEADANLDEDSRLKAPSVLETIRLILTRFHADRGQQHLFMGGTFAYDLIASVECLPAVPEGINHCPDFCFYLAETLITLDHVKEQCQLAACVFAPGERDRLEQRLSELATACGERHESPKAESTLSGKVQASKSDAEFRADVERLKGNIVAGDIFQVVPSRCFTLPCPSPLAAYGKLKQTNPSPYMFYVNDQDFILFGASPESSVKFDHHSRQVEMYPIAGTRRRGFNPDGSINLDLDGRIELDLRQDAKETAEHLMLVDLARNDIARISEPGSRYVKDLLSVDRYSHVMHLVSRVVGTLRADLDALHGYQACMNMGTLTGAPKLRASELIREVEGQRRGSYGGAVGYVNGLGDMDTCIVIRSAFVSQGLAHVQAGAGVVYDSDPQSEADETRNKAAAVLNAIALSHGSTLAEVSA